MFQDEWAVTPTAPPVDGVLYPDDFASEPPRPAHRYSPVPPLIPPSRPHHETEETLPSWSERRLRAVLVPGSLMARFQALAAPHTARNLELCGILAGILVHYWILLTYDRLVVEIKLFLFLL
ncbi:hypothetical protein RR48_00209 [Papilio machaon]|uniref:Uncharacterized protein n=1 Tax=Papilio machaon TaxID=76193 RepID=A0A0N0PFP3_PAPMA|nr:hypothetical protein RR48_00209 [Papilio machaon]